MYRTKLIFKMLFHPATQFTGVLEVWASAGTYIKEFVHGDLNRTQPNVSTLLGKNVDILQLDVGSLKEGQWTQDDHLNMQLGTLPWEMPGTDGL
jgi:tRNA U54 and U55 pseudouridine synthase Pus10